jgi:hypothetical protein
MVSANCRIAAAWDVWEADEEAVVDMIAVNVPAFDLPRSLYELCNTLYCRYAIVLRSCFSGKSVMITRAEPLETSCSYGGISICCTDSMPWRSTHRA